MGTGTVVCEYSILTSIHMTSSTMRRMRSPSSSKPPITDTGMIQANGVSLPSLGHSADDTVYIYMEALYTPPLRITPFFFLFVSTYMYYHLYYYIAKYPLFQKKVLIQILC